VNTGNIKAIYVEVVEGQSAMRCGLCDWSWTFAHDVTALETMTRLARNHVSQVHGAFRPNSAEKARFPRSAHPASP
jgi:hypothetical protein